jgi:hypothetical protein
MGARFVGSVAEQFAGKLAVGIRVCLPGIPQSAIGSVSPLQFAEKLISPVESEPQALKRGWC